MKQAIPLPRLASLAVQGAELRYRADIAAAREVLRGSMRAILEDLGRIDVDVDALAVEVNRAGFPAALAYDDGMAPEAPPAPAAPAEAPPDVAEVATMPAEGPAAT